MGFYKCVCVCVCMCMCMCVFLIGKAKSFVKGCWLWRPIAANPKPVIISKTNLRIAARAYTQFLRSVISEMPMVFQCLHVKDVATWYWSPEGLGPMAVMELDCKEQFNKVKPEWVTQHMHEAIQCAVCNFALLVVYLQKPSPF